MHPQVNIRQNVRALIHIPQGKLHSGHHPLPNPGLVVSLGCGEEPGQVNIVAMVAMPPWMFLITKATAWPVGATGFVGQHRQERDKQQGVKSLAGAW